MKKILAVLLSLLMAFSLMPLTAFAEGDTTPPVIDTATLSITSETGSFPVTKGDKINVSVSITDNIGINGSAIIVFKSKLAEKNMGTYLDYNNTSGKFEGTLEVTDEDPSGGWRVEFLQATDTSDNTVTLYNSATGETGTVPSVDLSAFDFEVTGTSADIEPPVFDFNSMSVTLPEGKTKVINGDKVKFAVGVSDKSNISLVSVRVANFEKNSDSTVILKLNAQTGKYEGDFTVTASTVAGTWGIYNLYASDESSNTAVYYNSNTGLTPSADFSAYNFTVAEVCKVSFNTMGGNTIDPVYVEKGGTVDEPAIPVKEGLTYGGWYTVEACENHYSFKTPVTSNITLYAKWFVSATFSNWDRTTSKENVGGGYTIDGWMEARGCVNMGLEVGNRIILVARPDVGYVFSGWYKGVYTGTSQGQSAQPLDLNDPDNLLYTGTEYRESLDNNCVIIAVFGECSEHIDGETKTTKEPTCTEAGVETVYCKKCRKAFKTLPIPATGHNAVAVKAVAPTFTKTGKTAGSKCSECGKILTAQKTVPKLASPKLLKVTKAKKAFTAKWSKFNVDGYELRYSLKKNMKKSKTVKLSKSATGKKVKKLKSKKTYYVQLRGYKMINKKKVYSAWSAKKKVKIL